MILVVGVILIGAINPPAASGQTRSQIIGTIKDSSGGVLPGVTLTLTSPNMVGGAQTAVTSADGTYRFSNLPPGVYTVEAALQGFQTIKRTGLQVAASTTVTVDLAVAVGSMTETVTVTGATPVVDVKTAASTMKVDETFLQNLPFGNRTTRPQEIFAMAPGITTTRTAHGGFRDANNMMVDGVPSAIVGNIQSSSLNYSWMQEVQVVSLGANAEYGEFTGTVSNMIMKSGSNIFSGLFDYFTTRESWVAKNFGSLSPALQAKFASTQKVLSRWEATFQGGGPIVKDKLFFFAGADVYRNEYVNMGALPGPDGNPVAANEHWKRYLGKVNWSPATAVRIEGFIERDADDINPTATSMTSSVSNTSWIPKTLYNTRLTWTINDKTLYEARIGGLRTEQDFLPPARRTPSMVRTPTRTR
jgi:hypothetical protein